MSDPKPERKLRRKVIQVEILYDWEKTSLDDCDLNEINYHITEGDCSGRVRLIKDESLTEEEMAEALKGQDSDPSFLLGEDWEDHEE